MKFKLSFLFLAVSLLAACGNDEVSFNTQEQARAQAIENAEYNARNWRDTNAPDAKIIMRGDSTISSSCASGDGWATVDLKLPNGSMSQLKCSTVSGTIGCLPKEDFQSRSYAKQDGRCNSELPFPLPKIVK